MQMSKLYLGVVFTF